MNSTNNKWFNRGLFITLFLNTEIGIGGLYLVNYLNLSRDIKNKKREIQIEYLINAYRIINKVAGYPIMDYSQITEKDIKNIEALEDALADVQLFGSNQAIDSCKKAVPDNTSDPKVIKFRWEANELLLDIRRALRKELLLDEIDINKDRQEGISKLRWSKIMEHFFLSRDKNQTP